MPAIFFGSIGAVVETSELQRRAFNQAFDTCNLDWHWSQVTYAELLQQSGGCKRIATYAEQRGESVDAAAIHRVKSEIFQQALRESQLAPRPGVVETIAAATQKGIKLAFVTTTSADNVTALLAGLAHAIAPSDFDFITNAASIERPKPDPNCYCLALETLGERPEDCVAVEDNLAGVAAATSAGISCIAFPGENTFAHDFSAASFRTSRLNFDEIEPYFSATQVVVGSTHLDA